MFQKRVLSAIAMLAVFMSSTAIRVGAQITTSRINAIVTDPTGAPRPDVRVTALHVPSGTRTEARTRSDGRVSLPGLRVGGPYTVTVSSIGFQSNAQSNVFLNLGESSDLKFVLAPAVTQLSGVTVTGSVDPVFSESRTGAATAVSRQALATLPTISGRLESIVRLTPQSGGGMSFAGQDSRSNNITVDGSSFNNSFGLNNTPGDRTGVAPISLAAIEQLQVSIAPYDVRSGNFVGAGVNTVTRSGTNTFRGSLYHTYKNQNLTGKKAGSLAFDPGLFKYGNTGGWIGGPIVPNKLFYFFSYEDEKTSQPGTTFRANTGSETVVGNVTRVLASDLDALSAYLKTNFGYTTGPYTGYNNETPAKRLLGKLDFNLNDRNKLNLRYTRLDSKADILESNSTSLGFGNRRSNLNSLNFQGSNYGQLENIRSIVGEWNSLIGSHYANSLIIGYTNQNESREPKGQFFPLIDILDPATTSTYTSVGFEPFTPNNELRYQTRQIQDNFTISLPNNDLTFGASVENYQSQNVFFPGSQSVYTYNSLADFYADANGYLANPSRTVSPVNLRRFEVRYNNIPGQIKPTQPLKVIFTGLYGQDEWRVNPNFRVTAGLRVDVPFFAKTGFDNPLADNLLFRDENGNSGKYSSDKLPRANPLFSPRLGFNWDVSGDRSLQIRGGSGVFTGRPPYVWISNQIGQTGVLTGFELLNGTTAKPLTSRPFNPDPNRYKPATVTGAPAASYELDVTDPNFRFPQVWRSDIGVDKKIFWGLTATGEFLYNHDVNGMYYINANLPEAQSRFVGPGDRRPRFTTNRLNSNVTGAFILKNQNIGQSFNVAASVEKPFTNGFFLKSAYSYGVARNTIDPGSIASGSFTSNQVSGDPNNPGLSYSQNSPGHRFFTAGSLRREYFHFGATTISAFFEARTIGNVSYTFSGDMNGDGGFNNDLLYVPRDQSEMNFETYTIKATTTTPAVTFTAQQQADAWEAYIKQDAYLSKHRGEYTQRNAVFLPLVKRLDFGFAQELFAKTAGRRNTFEFRADIVNFGNLLNKNWGLGQRIVNTQPLTNPTVDAFGRSTYRLRAINNVLMDHSLEQTAGSADTYRVQIGFRYTFN
ncbi:MAG: TonB-dependent receptor [Gemmatimonadaceae bacterium]|nr:TonB-dependent receptor [Gemmatimonadaceae bacterium]